MPGAIKLPTGTPLAVVHPEVGRSIAIWIMKRSAVLSRFDFEVTLTKDVAGGLIWLESENTICNNVGVKHTGVRGIVADRARQCPK